MAELELREAIRQALDEELDRDERVVLFGEDVAAAGGVFAATTGLHAKLGAGRVFDTPISELAMTGAAYGAAITGLRPVLEIMFGDFLGLSMDSLVNQASKYWFLSGGKHSVPLVIRSVVGAGGRFGGIHSQMPVSWLMGVPGIKIVGPSTPADAKGLLKAAIRDPNPVIFLEHEMLYGQEFDVPELDDWVVPIGKAKVRRAGKDVTISTHSRMVGFALQAAEELAKDGIEAEVIDLRTLRPLDHATVVESVRKTNRLVTVEEGWGPMGVGAEVAARVVEEAFDWLDAPPARVCQEDVPLPYAANLEALSLPSVERIVKAAKAVCYR
jgi:pyruvate dehydrogenase E1 component beta subunit